MSGLVDAVYDAKQKKHEGPEPAGWRARIAAIDTGAGTVEVVVYDQHPTKRWTAPYTPHPGPAHPSPGDRALVVFDNDWNPWVVSWIATA